MAYPLVLFSSDMSQIGKEIFTKLSSRAQYHQRISWTNINEVLSVIPILPLLVFFFSPLYHTQELIGGLVH